MNIIRIDNFIPMPWVDYSCNFMCSLKFISLPFIVMFALAFLVWYVNRICKVETLENVGVKNG